jgi:hypothetical protein
MKIVKTGRCRGEPVKVREKVGDCFAGRIACGLLAKTN